MYYRYTAKPNSPWITIKTSEFNSSLLLQERKERGVIETRPQQPPTPKQARQQRAFRIMGTLARTIANLDEITQTLSSELSSTDRQYIGATNQILRAKLKQLRTGG